jgi:hypothetical protein
MIDVIDDALRLLISLIFTDRLRLGRHHRRSIGVDW